jgi:Fe-S-cluster containining protein
VNAPKTPRLATDILWHLYHENVSVFVDEDQEWYVQFETRCRNLLPDNRCAIYEHRPVICRVYEETSCEVNQTRPNTITFREPDEFLKYLGLVNPKLLARIERQYVPLKRPTVASEQSR